MNDELQQWLEDVADAIRDVLRWEAQNLTASLWAAAPALLLSAEYEDAQPDGSPRNQTVSVARHWATVTSRTRGPTAILQGDVLFVYDQVNPRRTLEAIIDTRTTPSLTPTRIGQPISLRPLAAWTRKSRRLLKLTERTLAERGLRAPTALSETLLAAARALTRAESTIAAHDLECVVVATQHGTSARAYLHCARAAGVPTVYLPHAPVADNVQYRDLPCDYAGLRGNGEVAFYQDLGVRADLRIVGNPAASISASRASKAASANRDWPVFAPSPIPVAQLRPQVELVRKVFGASVTLAPHPAIQHHSDYEALWPDWRVHGGRTLELLQDGVSFLIQSSSGVAWESIAHGIPTIELSLHGGPARYPFIREPEVPYVRCEQELRDAFNSARREPNSVRLDRIKWARHWCAETGPAAAELAADLIAHAVHEGAKDDAIWDAWRAPST